MRAVWTSGIVLLLSTAQNVSHGGCAAGRNTSIPISSPSTAFQIRSDGTVIDSRTGLMWTRCLLGQTVINNACTGTAALYTWADALNAAKVQNIAGHTDWRLPNVKELLSILEDQCANPALNADVFPVTQQFGVWSATPTMDTLDGILDDAWMMESTGWVRPLSKNQTTALLLVRTAN